MRHFCFHVKFESCFTKNRSLPAQFQAINRTFVKSKPWQWQLGNWMAPGLIGRRMVFREQGQVQIQIQIQTQYDTNTRLMVLSDANTNTNTKVQNKYRTKYKYKFKRTQWLASFLAGEWLARSGLRCSTGRRPIHLRRWQHWQENLPSKSKERDFCGKYSLQ